MKVDASIEVQFCLLEQIDILSLVESSSYPLEVIQHVPLNL